MERKTKSDFELQIPETYSNETLTVCTHPGRNDDGLCWGMGAEFNFLEFILQLQLLVLFDHNKFIAFFVALL